MDAERGRGTWTRNARNVDVRGVRNHLSLGWECPRTPTLQLRGSEFEVSSIQSHAGGWGLGLAFFSALLLWLGLGAGWLGAGGWGGGEMGGR